MRGNELADKGYVAGCDHAMSIAEDGLHAVACLKSRWNASGFCFPRHLQGGCLLTRLSMEIMHVCRKDTVGRLIAAASSLKHQTALSVAYGTGLRTSEVVGSEGRRHRQPTHDPAH